MHILFSMPWLTGLPTSKTTPWLTTCTGLAWCPVPVGGPCPVLQRTTLSKTAIARAAAILYVQGRQRGDGKVRVMRMVRGRDRREGRRSQGHFIGHVTKAVCVRACSCLSASRPWQFVRRRAEHPQPKLKGRSPGGGARNHSIAAAKDAATTSVSNGTSSA